MLKILGVRRFENIIKPDHVFIVELLKNLDLPKQALRIDDVLEQVQHFLNRNPSSRWNMDCLGYFAVATPSYYLYDLEILSHLPFFGLLNRHHFWT